MKFVKLNLKTSRDPKHAIQWNMIIDNIEDLKAYHNLEATLNAEAFLDLGKTKRAGHLGDDNPRMLVIDSLLKIKAHRQDGEKTYPIIEVAKLTDQKYLSMLRLLSNGETIRVNKAGGYCTLDGFLETWGGEIIETIEKDDIGFPIDEEVIKCDTLILENSFNFYAGNDFKKELKILLGEKVGTIGVINSLRTIDKAYIIKALLNAKNVYISTQLLDDKQLDDFMTLFSNLPSKTVFLRMFGDKIEQLKAHPLFEVNNNIHKIVFFN